MTDTVEPQLNRRQRAKARTRAKVMEAARVLFADGYGPATIRAIAKGAGMSTGAVFANFKDKAELWREVMGTEPPVETPLTRAAPAMLTALKAAEVVMAKNIYPKPDVGPEHPWSILKAMRAAIAQAEGAA